MRQFWVLLALMALGSAAEAGNSLSFSVGGHRMRIEAPTRCSSPSCVSVSIPGVYQSGGGGGRYDRDDRYDRYDDDARDVAPATVPASAPVAAVAVPVRPAAEPARATPPAAVYKPAAAATQPVPAPSAPQIQAPKPLPELPRPAEIAAAQPQPAPRISQVWNQTEDESADSPLGEWQTESKGSVRIERCGSALCGYVLKASTTGNGEAVLINMKPKTDSQWSGNVYSQDSGDIYYGTMMMKGRDALRVEACALGRFYCSGNVWTRITRRPERLISSRQISPEPRS